MLGSSDEKADGVLRKAREAIMTEPELEEWRDQGRLETVSLPPVPWESITLNGRCTKYTISRADLLRLDLAGSSTRR